MKRYRLEIFGRDLLFKSFSEASEPDIHIDYLVQTNSTIECPKEIICSRGDFAQIRIDGVVYYQGVITDWTYDGLSTSLTIQQMSSILDFDVYADVTTLNSGEKDIETWMAELLTGVFDGADTFQNLKGLTIVKNSSTTGSKTADDNGIYNLYDLAVYFFKTYGVLIDIDFDVSSQTTKFTFSGVSSSVMKLNLEISDVESYDVEPSLSSTSPNKMVIRNKENPAEEETYYWHPTDFSGTVDTDATTNRVLPVITKCENVTVGEDETFADVAIATARNNMYQSRYDDLITVVLRSDSNLIKIGGVGQQYTLYTKGKIYYTVLTGIHAVNMRYIECTFGYVRKRLTQILRMKG